MLYHQDQNLDPLLENFVQDAERGYPFRPDPLQLSPQWFACPRVSGNSFQTAIYLLLESWIQGFVLSLRSVREYQLIHGDYFNGRRLVGQCRQSTTPL